MNKLVVVEDKKSIKKGEYQIKVQNNSVIKIEEEVILHEDSKESKIEQIVLAPSSSLTLYQVKIVNEDYHIHFAINQEAKLDYKVLILNKGKHQVAVDITMQENDAKANIEVRILNLEEKSSIDFICNGKVLSNTHNNELLENLKGLIIHEEDSIKISPNMIIDTNLVLANHLVTIGPIDKEAQFYLKMKGLSEEKANELLINAFMTSHLTEYEKNLLKQEVIINE